MPCRPLRRGAPDRNRTDTDREVLRIFLPATAFAAAGATGRRRSGSGARLHHRLRLRCPPSALYTFPARVSPRGLARRCLVALGAPGGSPSLTGVVPRVSTRALNRSSSPLRLPISPPGPRGMVTAAPSLGGAGHPAQSPPSASDAGSGDHPTWIRGRCSTVPSPPQWPLSPLPGIPDKTGRSRTEGRRTDVRRRRSEEAPLRRTASSVRRRSKTARASGLFGSRRNRSTLEARAGVEPTWTDLQSAA